MKNTKLAFSKSLLVSILLSLSASLVVVALWSIGLLASIEAIFVLTPGTVEIATLPLSTALLIIALTGIGAGVGVECAGARRTISFLAIALVLLGTLSLLVSRFYAINILFVPVALSTLLAAFTAQMWRLSTIDALLSSSLQRTAALAIGATGPAADERLMSGLKLLATVLPLDEAVVFRRDETGALQPAARLRSNVPSETAEANRLATWREGIALCERGIAARVITTSNDAAESNIRRDSRSHASGHEPRNGTSIAIPLEHEAQVVGALLVRLIDSFDNDDRSLLQAVSSQLSRDLQRDEARRSGTINNRLTYVSVSAAEARRQLAGVVSGLLTEQSFAMPVLAEANDGHAVVHLDGTIAYVNPTMLQVARLTAQEVRAFDLFELLNCFRTGVFDEPQIAVRRVLQTGEPYERELHFADRNQSLSLSIRLLMSDADSSAARMPLCLCVTVRDVTQLKEHDKLKSDMLSLMSHELRTPITSINGFAELLSTDETVPEEAREFLRIIRSESQRLSRMIDTFLAVTKLEAADRQEVLKIPLLLNDVVRETITNLQPIAKRKRIRLVEKLPVKLPPVAADRSLVTQVVTNLINNAIKYSPDRTTVTVAVDLEADHVRLSVEDRGYGIPPEALSRVWEKFYRVARDGQEKEEESTGLGLSFVREVIEQHGGQVALESEIGRGSTFSVTLPRL